MEKEKDCRDCKHFVEVDMYRCSLNKYIFLETCEACGDFEPKDN